MLNKILDPLRQSVRRFLQLPDQEKSYVGRHGCLKTAAQFITWNQVPGDYLEFGVFQGESFAAAYHSITGLREKHGTRGFLGGSNSPEYQKWHSERPRFIAFDSFEGLPDVENHRHVDYKAGSYCCAEDDFRRNIQNRKVDMKDVIIVKGFYDKTLNEVTRKKYSLTKASMVMIDCDLYESTVPVLNFLTDIVQQGTILIFDDWFRFKGNPRLGEQGAFNEWVKRNPHLELIEYWREGPQAVSFLVNFR